MSHWSKNAVEYFGLPGEYIFDPVAIWANYVHPDDREAFLNDIDDIFSRRKLRHSLDYRVKNKSDENSGEISDGLSDDELNELIDFDEKIKKLSEKGD